MIDHMTLTGRYAGQTYCGAPRMPGLVYAHLPYLLSEQVNAWADRFLRCEQCKEILKSSNSGEA